jgi:hypothetical protein
MERFFLRTLPLREDGKVRRIDLRVRGSRKDPAPLFPQSWKDGRLPRKGQDDRKMGEEKMDLQQARRGILRRERLNGCDGDAKTLRRG